MIEISASAQTYLGELLAKQEDENVGIRVFVAQPGTPQAETCIAYCRPGEEQEGDLPVAYGGVTAWVERPGTLAVGDAMTLFVPDQRGWQPEG